MNVSIQTLSNSSIIRSFDAIQSSCLERRKIDLFHAIQYEYVTDVTKFYLHEMNIRANVASKINKKSVCTLLKAADGDKESIASND
jgi:hypothetical protein